jgi:hypothetical protein
MGKVAHNSLQTEDCRLPIGLMIAGCRLTDWGLSIDDWIDDWRLPIDGLGIDDWRLPIDGLGIGDWGLASAD